MWFSGPVWITAPRCGLRAVLREKSYLSFRGFKNSVFILNVNTNEVNGNVLKSLISYSVDFY